MTEFELIRRVFQDQAASDAFRNKGVEKGIGDDAAVISLPPDTRLVSCVDTLVQGRHFSGDWDAVERLAFAIGYKAVAVNVSDIAAMGAAPHSILLALALPERLANGNWLTDFAKGLFHACQMFDVALIGGDTTRCETLVLSVTAQGILDKNMPAVYRSGAKIGDKLYVTGSIGDAAYALKHADDAIGIELAHRLHMPTPRMRCGKAVAKAGATAMIDISDGLYQDLSHICQQSGVAMRIHLDDLPTSTPLASVDLTTRLLCQLTGGDDYELAFTLPAHTLLPECGTLITCIGEVVALDNDHIAQPQLFYQGVAVTSEHPAPFTTLPTLSGYQHFAG